METKETGGSARNAAIILVGSQLLAAVAALAVNMLAARVLDPSARGDLAYALQLTYFLGVFAMMGLERPFMASRTGSFNSEYRVFMRMVRPGIHLVIPIAIVLALFSPFSASWLWVGALLIGLYIGLNSMVVGVRVAYVSSLDLKKFGFNAITSQIIIILGALLLTLLNVSNSVLWLVVYVASGIPALILMWTAVRRGEEPNWPSEAETKALRRRGWVLLPSAFSNSAMTYADRLLLPILSSSAQLGLYVTVSTVIQMATWPVQQWVDASLRNWSKAMKESTAPIRGPILKLMGQSILLLIGFTVALSFATYLMILYVLPDAYMAAMNVIIPLAVSSVVFGITRVQQGILISLGAEGRVSLVELIGTAASLVAYLALIPSLGMLGAAYGSIVGYGVTAIGGAIALTYVARARSRA
ncbi:lipopolysaccharide biosynthesis protein [Corynebacterium lubricantis]|uniref:lipopolysaccharide biosynthesis protein n=1 Tax=Corynebacterium lubricantis TaxID=541095 RepID=UPI000375A2D0|nr:oligosaccharide flippase family protein [Corynebacterium lubricantis]